MHIAIAGNIGSGKTTLTKLLSDNYGWKPHYEDVDHNPYLDDFYADMHRWAFNLQIYFLNSRFRQIKEIQDSKETYIQDRTIYEDVRIFASNLHGMGLINNRDFDNYQSLFELMNSFISPPDLLIYLRADIKTLVGNIHKRGRDYESSISIDYLSRLNERYEAWIETYDQGKILIVDVNNLDFLDNKKDFEFILKNIETQIKELENNK